MEIHESEARLKKEISFLGLVAVFVGMNIGGALFSLTIVAADITGPSLPIAMIMASIPSLLALVPYSMFSTAYPTTSATYRYCQLLNPQLAFIAMFTLLLCMLVGAQPLFAMTFGQYFDDLFAADINPAVVGVIVLAVFYVVNLLGIKFTAQLQTILFIVMMAALILYVVLGVPHVRVENFTPMFPNGVGKFIAATGMLFTFCAGGLFAVDLGGEVIDGSRRYKRALVTGMGIVVGIYLLIHIVTVGAERWDALKAKGTLTTVAGNFMSPGLVDFFIIGGALVACATTINIIFTVISRGFVVISGEKIFPDFMGKVGEKSGTPYWGLTFIFIVCAASLLILASIGQKPVTIFGAMTNFGLIFPITVVCLAGAIVPFKMNAIYEKSRFKISKRLVAAVSWTAVILNTAIFLLLCMLMISIKLHLTVIMFFVFMAISALYYYGRKMVLKKRGIKMPGRPMFK
ncbi:MAG: amino acid permease [Deltaproteobacteria bacterium]|uniref:Amino acid permease n=1 Tax=Candidatus Zymogenus saltonus TaxID=2844893 RepID=A0A9D8KE17_9DELT|nr:amino acid permease [Candidatus Zymogenus saltonus]